MKFSNLDILWRSQATKVIQEETDHLNVLMATKEAKFIVKTYHKQNSSPSLKTSPKKTIDSRGRNN